MRISDWSSDVCSSDLADRDDAQDDRDGDDVLGVLSHGMYLLEPDAQARHETGIVDVIALATAKVCGAAVCALPGHADVRRELAADLVAQAQASLGRAQARADAAAGVVLAVELGLDLPLQDQPVGQQRVVLGFQA